MPSKKKSTISNKNNDGFNESSDEEVSNVSNNSDDPNSDAFIPNTTVKTRSKVSIKVVSKERLKKNEYNSKKAKCEYIMESNKNDPILSNILGNDDKLLFSLNSLGSLQKNEKLTEKGELLSVDDRWLFQGLRRWWSEDSRKKSANKTLIVISDVADRITKLLDDDYLARLEKEKKKDDSKNSKPGLETPDEKHFRERCEERRRLINKYFISLNKAKAGIENSRDTYIDKFTKNTFDLSIQKAEDILNRLQKFKGTV